MESLDKTEVERWLITASLVGGAVIAWTCPCKNPFLNCHKYQFYALVGLPLVYVAYNNTIGSVGGTGELPMVMARPGAY